MVWCYRGRRWLSLGGSSEVGIRCGICSGFGARVSVAVEFLLQYCLRLPYGGEAVWLNLGGGGRRAADDLVEGPNDVNFNMRASKEEDP